MNEAWISALPHCLNYTELSWEESLDNLCLRYGLTPQDIPVACDGCGDKFYIENALSLPEGGLVLKRHKYAKNEWGDLGALSLDFRSKPYEPKINIRTVQGERNKAGAQR